MSKGKILVIDDEPHILTVVQFLVEREGYEARAVQNGEEAMKTLSHFRPDIIILDVMMPGLNGYEIAKQIRKEEQFQDVRIVFLSAKGTQKDRFDGYQSGGEVYLTKPFDNQELLDTINEVMEFG